MHRNWRHVPGFVLACCLFNAAAFGAPAAMRTSEQVSSAINQELGVGAPQSDIERFFQRHGISFGWDVFGDRYVAIIRDVGPFHSITIDVYVDDQRRFSRAVVKDSYTAIP